MKASTLLVDHVYKVVYPNRVHFLYIEKKDANYIRAINAVTGKLAWATEYIAIDEKRYGITEVCHKCEFKDKYPEEFI